jgi:transposase
MDRARVHEEVRQMRFEGLLERHERGELSQGEAAEMLGMGERTFRRWRDRLRDEGPSGLADRRLGKPSVRRAKAAEIARMLELYSGSYADFTVKHFHERLSKRHDYKLDYTVTKVHLHRAAWRRQRRGARRIARSARAGRWWA